LNTGGREAGAGAGRGGGVPWAAMTPSVRLVMLTVLFVTLVMPMILLRISVRSAQRSCVVDDVVCAYSVAGTSNVPATHDANAGFPSAGIASSR
jgi:hypothetical protein